MKKIDYYEICDRKLNYLGYSEHTVNAYLFYIRQFLETIKISPSRLTAEHFQRYLDTYPFTSNSQQNQVISAIKFLYTNGLNKKYGKVDFRRPREEKKLPRVIDHDLIVSQLAAIRNIKHRAILTLTYSAGLRISEIVNLEIKDIDSERMIIHIKNAKGRKDRIVPLSENVLQLLRKYFRKYRPQHYLFNGQGRLRYSKTSCRKIMKSLISEDHRFHDLRHSFATYLVEKDTNLRKVADLLGHTKTRTTEIYTHVSRKALANISLPI